VRAAADASKALMPTSDAAADATAALVSTDYAAADPSDDVDLAANSSLKTVW
jgi:hypothetical protein